MRIKELTVIIVTFKSEDKIINCLNSLPDNVDVIVVENSSNNEFKKILKKIF